MAEAIAVENLVLKRDGGVLTLKSGTLGLMPPAMGRDIEAVFIGEGEFTFSPTQNTEKEYLKSLTGQDSVREAFDRALFCFTDETGKEIRAQRGKSGPADNRLNDALRDFRDRLRNSPEVPRSFWEAMLTSESIDNIEADILTDLYNPSHPGFFTAYLRGRKHDDLRFLVKPRGAMPGLPSPEEVAIINFDPQGNEEGVWYLGHLQSEITAGKASSEEDKRVAQAVSYRIETAIAGNDHLTGVTELRFRAITAGDRVVRLELLPSLRVKQVSVGERQTPFIQEDRKQDGSFYVILPEPLKPGSEYALTIQYEGDKVMKKAGGGNFSIEARSSWYPSLNAFQDQARYDLTFKVPRRYTLIGVGKLDREWRDGDLACSHWVSELPLKVAGFSYGQFKQKKLVDSDSGFAIEGYATEFVPDYLQGLGDNNITPSTLIERTATEALNAGRIYEAYFGKSAFGRVALAQQPDFSSGQSWPTLIYLPLTAYLDSTQRWQIMEGIDRELTEFVEEVTSHELSHQWWGHMVGWKTYRDQWLSEGLATFSAGLFLQLTEKNPDRYLNYWEHARKRILEKNQFGRRPNDAGPMWMGLRLRSTRNSRGYSSVAYDKGGYVIHMLRQLMRDQAAGDKYFIAMMQDFVREHQNRLATTESFKRIVEKHMRPNMDVQGNGKLDWFFSQWVYGTAVPRYKLDQTLTQQGDKWLLQGSITQSEVPGDFVMPVPLYADFDGQIVRLGAARITGNSSIPLNIPLPKKPRRVMLNAWRDVLEQ